MRIVGYVRVSTDKQIEEGLGLEVQESEIRRWARANKHNLVAITRDEARSGTAELDDRPGLADALRMVRASKWITRPTGTAWAHAIVVARLDRLARDLVLQEQLLLEIHRAGGELFSTSAAEAAYLKDDPDDPSRALIRHILGAVSQYERSMIRLRLMAGRRRKLERGGYAGGQPRFGYRAEQRELVADPDEQAALARMRQLRRQGRSLREIAGALTAEGFKPKRSERWHPEVLRAILERS